MLLDYRLQILLSDGLFNQFDFSSCDEAIREYFYHLEKYRDQYSVVQLLERRDGKWGRICFTSRGIV